MHILNLIVHVLIRNAKKIPFPLIYLKLKSTVLLAYRSKVKILGTIVNSNLAFLVDILSHYFLQKFILY